MCKTCGYYKEIYKDSGGECRKHAPDSIGDWPLVYEWDWCGDWTKKQDNKVGE
ncbi:MAG: hypothetical protein PVF17_12170 [Ignavibacteria bacterium]|jgi:hypothetical protein